MPPVATITIVAKEDGASALEDLLGHVSLLIDEDEDYKPFVETYYVTSDGYDPKEV